MVIAEQTLEAAEDLLLQTSGPCDVALGKERSSEVVHDGEWLEQGWVDPVSPSGPVWTDPNAPREMVSWHEAVAFCRWLDHRRRDQGRLGPDQEIRLPTEWEWQLAATGGDPDRTYPWGKAWEPDRLNSDQSVGRTTAVGLYPRGAAPCGALDLAGNVFEWCANHYDEPRVTATAGADPRALRGGSWVGARVGCRAACRLRSSPNARGVDIGFRLCLSSPIAER
jgi:formylglycine-generating enzyme required for sulfatase activity